uniref:hypothetical protein n=1 Tax=Nonomuraea pusilla TaxID=46177 RepID=UPI000B238DD7|nr:hypothetical protein [Nonomuraea pusilla]
MRPIEKGDLPVVTRVLTGSWGGCTVMALGPGVAAGRRAGGRPIRHELELELALR